MKPIIIRAVIFCIIMAIVIYSSSASKKGANGCMIGAFLSDYPTVADIEAFKRDYGKKPYIVLIFIEWDAFIRPQIIKAVYGQGSSLMVTWEPWHFSDKKAIDFELLLSGGYDTYIREFAERLKAIDGEVYMRFAHEANGDWYPWSAAKIGKEKYIAVYRYVKNMFEKLGVKNVKWVFAVNWEDIPRSNGYKNIYPGDKYVDFIGIDGYNWGKSQSWSKPMGFSAIFKKRYEDIVHSYGKPVIISEFATSSSGVDKRKWIADAMSQMKKLKDVKAFVIFNVDKETDWSLLPEGEAGIEFKKQIADDYFKER